MLNYSQCKWFGLCFLGSSVSFAGQRSIKENNTPSVCLTCIENNVVLLCGFVGLLSAAACVSAREAFTAALKAYEEL